ncbi:MAG: LysR family hydrogen peroxide-inducible transcriptional activator [Pseudohongiellaceae bacterium]|jgi:LysR family hydrogen peroxide-inducible transcriptional activator
MNLKDLKYFLAIAELKHFGHAAQQCNVSQPTLSGQIKKLEETLGVMLFERTNRRVMLTEAGHHIVIYAKRIIREVDAIHEIADSTRDPLAGKFRLGAFPTLATYIFPRIVPQVKASMPNLRLILMEEKTSQLIDQLHNGEIDAALLALPIQDDYLISKPLFDDEFFLAVPSGHDLTKYKTVDQTKLKQHRLLLLEEGHCLRDQSLEICQLHNIGEEQDFKATGLETLRQMVKAGTGITFMPKIAIQAKETGIEYIPFTKPAPSRSIGLVWRKTTPRQQVIKELIKLI